MEERVQKGDEVEAEAEEEVVHVEGRKGGVNDELVLKDRWNGKC